MSSSRAKDAVRRDVADLAINDKEEFLRFAVAFSRLKASGDDWSCLCAIHGGGFPIKDEYEEKILPMLEWYNEEFKMKNEFTKDTWNSAAFCAHGIPLFFIWHRPYMRCFELALQQHDPKAGDPNFAQPLALHYWAWDQTPVGEVPDWASDPFYFGKLPNPFISGHRYPIDDTRLPKQNGMDGTEMTRRDGRFNGVGLPLSEEVWNAFKDRPNYWQVCTTNGIDNAVNFENPHNMLHNNVGGAAPADLDPKGDFAYGDMQDASISSWDPIFWLHHSNIERFQYAYIHTHGLPKEDEMIPLKSSKKLIVPLTFNGTHLYPFASRDTMTKDGYESAPWLRPARKNNLSTMGEWFDNAGLGYTYDRKGLEVLGIKPAPALKAAGKVPVKPLNLAISNIPVRGSGVIKAILKVGHRTIELPEKGLFSFRREVVCANCESRDLSLSWELPLSEEEAIGATIHSLTFRDRNILDEKTLLSFYRHGPPKNKRGLRDLVHFHEVSGASSAAASSSGSASASASSPQKRIPEVKGAEPRKRAKVGK